MPFHKDRAYRGKSHSIRENRFTVPLLLILFFIITGVELAYLTGLLNLKQLGKSDNKGFNTLLKNDLAQQSLPTTPAIVDAIPQKSRTEPFIIHYNINSEAYTKTNATIISVVQSGKKYTVKLDTNQNATVMIGMNTELYKAFFVLDENGGIAQVGNRKAENTLLNNLKAGQRICVEYKDALFSSDTAFIVKSFAVLE